jgi:hypothetical protein
MSKEIDELFRVADRVIIDNPMLVADVKKRPEGIVWLIGRALAINASLDKKKLETVFKAKLGIQ